MRTLSFFPSPAALGLAGLFLAPALSAQLAFGPQQVVTMSASAPFGVRAADLDGDGDQDVIYATQFGGVVWQANLGSGNYGPANLITFRGTAFRVHDIDLDGDQDVITSDLTVNDVGWLANNGSGNFGLRQVIASGGNPRIMDPCDVNNDGLPDVVCTSVTGTIWIANTGSGTFGGPNLAHPTSTNEQHRSATFSDIDGDGDEDAIIAHDINGGAPAEFITWHVNDGANNFGPAQLLFSGRANEVIARDLDGDGDTDVISRSNYVLEWFANDGAGNFSVPNSIDPSFLAGLIHINDLDQDGDLDVLATKSTTLSYYVNQGGGNFSTPQLITNNLSVANSPLAADLDGDGDLDALCASFTNKNIVAYENVSPPPSEVLGAGCAGLSLSGNPMRLDSSWDLQLGSVAATSPFGVFFVGGAALEPGVPLTATCSAYTTADLGFFLQPVVAGASTWSLAVPNDPSLVGAQLTVQGTAASADPTAWNGIALSNGLRGTVGQ